MSYTDYIFKVVFIEALFSRDVFYIIYFAYLTNDSVQRHIVGLKRFAICFAKDKPTAIMFLQELGMKCQLKWLLAKGLIGESQYQSVSNSLIEYRQLINVRKVLF